VEDKQIIVGTDGLKAFEVITGAPSELDEASKETGDAPRS
jgi:hypothetical protein